MGAPHHWRNHPLRAVMGSSTVMKVKTNMALRALLIFLNALTSLIPGGVPAEAASQIVFTPHRAIYDLTLDRTLPGAGVADLNGRLVYEITGSACEGYTQNMRFVTRSANQDGQIQTTDLRTSSWEDGLATRLRFSTTNYQNDIIAEQSQGDASRNDGASQASIKLVKPSKKPATIPGGVYFPIQHSMALIEAARAGKPILVAELFDGSENGEKVFSTSAALGKLSIAGAVAMPANVKNGDKLAGVPSFPVSISYFENADAKKDVIPSYEMKYRFHENGVTSDLLIDHGEFAFRGELKELEFLPQSKCPGSAQ